MFKHRSVFPSRDRLYDQNIASVEDLLFLLLQLGNNNKKNHRSIFPEEKSNINKSKYFLYFLQNHVDLRIGMGGEKKREEEGVVKKLHYSYFRQLEHEVQIETTFHWKNANIF